VRTEASSGILLMVVAIVAVVWANSPFAPAYSQLWETPVRLSFGEYSLSLSLLHWINDGLMAVFFFAVGLEIKRELLVGHLADIRQAVLPIVGAVGGMVVPALIFAAMNRGTPSANGWGIPMATDIAFALGALSLLGSRIPTSLKVFLAAVAIVDDLGAVLVIAVFYSGGIVWGSLGIAALLLLGLVILARIGVRNPALYLLTGVVVWLLFLNSGVHATVAGVLLAMCIPARVKLEASEFAREAQGRLDEFKDLIPGQMTASITGEQQAALHDLEVACEKAQMPLQRIGDKIQPLVSFGIMPIFAFANAGIALEGSSLAGLRSPIGLGIILGLVLGKPIGILLSVWLAVKGRLVALPVDVDWRQMSGVGALAGIGFTMSLFISGLAFVGEAYSNWAKLAICCASLISGGLGLAILAKSKSKNTNEP
ncbi:MAG TPA: Na+/H+ antiporter NhaA, partial [Fimbriimonadaceae bacterium]|nr:Na+/H+ antiporter NhaA [Fimbriimonadaceae bacterium]